MLGNTSTNYSSENLGNGYVFTFPAKRNWTRIIQVSITLVVVLFLLYGTIADAIKGFKDLNFNPLTVIITLAFLLGVLEIPVEILWYLFGADLVNFSQTEITIKHHIFGLGLTSRHPIESVKAISVSPPQSKWKIRWGKRGEGSFFGSTVGLIEIIRTTGNIIKIGNRITAEEAAAILQQLKWQYPNLIVDPVQPAIESPR